jgi:two-component system, LuxR family, response regulator FixJ
MSPHPCIFIVDDDDAVRESLTLIIENAGLTCQDFSSAEDFLKKINPNESGCLILDVNLPGITGHELQAELNRRENYLPIIFLSAYGDVPLTVRAMKAGAVDFLTKPVPSKLLIERIQAVLEHESQQSEKSKKFKNFQSLIDNLTFREKEILPLAIAGINNKEIAQRLGISYRTVETHRIRILRKTGTVNFLELARLCEEYKHISN